MLSFSALPDLPDRLAESHKGSFGTSLLIGGSRGMSGAIQLAGITSLRAGCGLTFIACPASVQPIVAGADPSYLTISLAEDAEGKISTAAIDRIYKQLPNCNAVGIGPGIGQSAGLDRLIGALYHEIQQPAVFDADGLNALARQSELLTQHAGPRILTPHPGEMSRLLDVSIDEIQHNREEVARDFARANQCIVLLKGNQTIVSDGTSSFINSTGNDGLATGGSGDVLTGLLTSLLAQGLTPFHAACWAAHLHGQAGDMAVEELGCRGVIASDLPRFVACALKDHQ